ncbi:MAG: hypothetical protein EON54_03270 [Alcaligenaceae bacterium]|nr:MAG: hypothetical protein EON54_03270 [Alcaligenaceae bacterium]
MKLLDMLFKSVDPTSANIMDQIATARSEYESAIAARATLLAGLSTFNDAQHQKAEAQCEAYRRAADRAAARVADLEAMRKDALAAEALAQRAEIDDALRQRAEVARHANRTEAADLLNEYDALAVKIAEIFARLDAIDAAREAVNMALRSNPVAKPVQSYERYHRKHADREAAVRKEKALCWVYRYPAVPRDGEGETYLQIEATEEVRRATIGRDGKPQPMLPEIYHRMLITPVLEEREVEVHTRFRSGRSEARLSEVVLPPGFAGGKRHWPC